MSIKRVSSVALSTIMATTAMLPLSAFAQQTPSVEYTGGNGDPITHLYLIADDDNLATNYGSEDGANAPALNAKVQVPVAINYVAQANGDITGPSDNQAQIRNFSGFPVNVANIKVNAGANVTLVSTPEAADTADEIYLQMKPNSGTILSMADYTPSATETSAGTGNGTGKRPTAGAEWNIAAAQSGVGTSSAVASVLNLNALSGKIGGFNLLNPAVKQEIGQIEWTVKAGSVSGVPVLPSTSTFASTSVSEFAAIGNYLRSGNADQTYVNNAKTLVGQTVEVPINTGTMEVRLVSVDTQRGLTFEAVDVLTKAKANAVDSCTGGWEVCDLRKSLNQASFTDANGATVTNGIFATYFEGTQLASLAQSTQISSATMSNAYVTTTDKFWVPARNNLTFSSMADGNETIFDYYVTHNQEADRNKNMNGESQSYWLRSLHPISGDAFASIMLGGSGTMANFNASSITGVAPCFCL